MLLKRIFDIIFSSCALLAFLPVGVPLVFILKLTGEGNIFYLQSRVGQYGRAFKLYKFATMLENSPNIGSGDITLKNDSRVLPVGRFLRKTKLNEIPQFINVLLGDMSVVGPRPLTMSTFSFYPQAFQDQVASIKPGVTGIGSIVYRDEESIFDTCNMPYDECYKKVIGPHKARLALWYKHNSSFFVDMIIIVLTIIVIFIPSTKLYYNVFPDLPRQ